MESGEGFVDESKDGPDDLSNFDFDLLTQAGDGTIWCDQCKVYQQEIENLKKTNAEKLTTWKKKIISTDLLIKKYKTKCEDFDVQTKELTEANKKADQYHREAELLKTQLTSLLTQLEPAKRANVTLEAELKAKVKEIQSLKDKVSAQEVMQKQYDLLNSTSTDYKQRLEATRKEHAKFLKDSEIKNQKQEALISKLKEELKSVKNENLNCVKLQRCHASNLKKTIKRMDEYHQILKEKGLLPRGQKRLKVETYFNSADSQEETSQEEESLEEVPVPAEENLETRNITDDKDDNIDNNDDEDDIFSLAFSFSPLANVLSPLPPSPVPLRNRVAEENNPDDCDEYLGDSDESEPMTTHSRQQYARKQLPQCHSPKLFQSNPLRKGSRSPLSYSLRNRILTKDLKSNKKHFTQHGNDTVPEKEYSKEKMKTEYNGFFVKGETMNLSDSDEENQALHSNVNKSDSFVKHENSAFKEFIKSSLDISQNNTHVRTNNGELCVKENSSDHKTDDQVSDKKRLIRSETGSFECSDGKGMLGDKTVKSIVSDNLSSKDDCVHTQDKEKLSEEKRKAQLSSPNRPITRTLTKSLSISSDSLLNEQNVLMNEMKLSPNHSSSLPNENAQSEVKLAKSSSVQQEKNNDVQQSLDPVSKKNVSEAAKRNLECSIAKKEMFCDQKEKLEQKGANERQLKVDSANKHTPSKLLLGSKDDANMNNSESVVACTRSRSKTKLLSGKLPNNDNTNTDVEIMSKTKLDVQRELNFDKSLNNVDHCLKEDRHVVHELKLDDRREVTAKETKTESSNSVNTPRTPESLRPLHNKEKSTDTGKEKTKGEESSDPVDDKRMTRSMARQCSTGFVLKSPPILSNENHEKEMSTERKDFNVVYTEGGDCSQNSQDQSMMESTNGSETGAVMTDKDVKRTDDVSNIPSPKLVDSNSSTSVTKDSVQNTVCTVKNSTVTIDGAYSVSECKLVGSEKGHSFAESSRTKDVEQTPLVSNVKEEHDKENSLQSYIKDSNKISTYVPNSACSSLLKSTLNKSIHSSQSPSTVVSPELAAFTGKLSNPASPRSSMSPSSPVSPLPPSPFEFLLPMPISPLPPSPLRDTRPLSPLPGSPAVSDENSLPMLNLPPVIGTPCSDSSDSTSLCTPVSFLTPLTATPQHRNTTLTPPSSGSSKFSGSLCNFHSQAPPDAITVKPHNSNVVAIKRSLSPSFEEKRKTPDKLLKSTSKPKQKKKRKSVDSGNLDLNDVSSEKKLCLQKECNSSANQPQKNLLEDNGIMKASLDTASDFKAEDLQGKGAVVKSVDHFAEIEKVMNRYMQNQSITVEEVTQVIKGINSVAYVCVVLMNWIVQKLKCSESEVFNFIVSYCKENQTCTTRTDPFLATGESRILQLLQYLFRQEEWKMSKEMLIKSIWKAIFLRDGVTICGRLALCRILTGIAKFDGDIELARVLFYHIMSCGYLNSSMLAVSIAGVWPKVLYRNKTGTSPVLVVMEHCLMQSLAENGDKSEKVVLCLMKLCNWSAPIHTSSDLLTHLLKSLEDKSADFQNQRDGVFEIEKCLELLLCEQKISFFKVFYTQTALKDVLFKIERQKKYNKEYVNIIMKVAGHFILTKYTELGQKYTQQIIKKYFIGVLSSLAVSCETQYLVLSCLLDLSFLAPMYIMTYGLHVWYTKSRDRIPWSWIEKMESTRKILLAQLPKFKCPVFS